jgi:hypothetical protein
MILFVIWTAHQKLESAGTNLQNYLNSVSSYGGRRVYYVKTEGLFRKLPRRKGTSRLGSSDFKSMDPSSPRHMCDAGPWIEIQHPRF